MHIGVVKGMIVATQKDQRLVGAKLLIVRRIDSAGELIGADEVAVDTLGAGVGERVLICGGSSAKALLNNAQAPIDLAVVGIIDNVE